MITSLITIDLHCRDVLDSLVEGRVVRSDDFEWTRNLRYEWNGEEDRCTVQQGFGGVQYCYEYLGCFPRLVVTPLTDRCYLTLMLALHLNLGGAPMGPAGTGKTESVKELARSLGKLCVVFNCSAAVESRMMGRLCSGLAQTGAWACFDEFNRIDVEVRDGRWHMRPRVDSVFFRWRFFFNSLVFTLIYMPPFFSPYPF